MDRGDLLHKALVNEAAISNGNSALFLVSCCLHSAQQVRKPSCLEHVPVPKNRLPWAPLALKRSDTSCLKRMFIA